MIFIRGLGPIPAFGTAGAAIGTALSAAASSPSIRGDATVQRHVGAGLPARVVEARLGDHSRTVPFRLAHRTAGHRDEHCRRDASALRRVDGIECARRRRRTRSATPSCFHWSPGRRSGLMGAAAAVAGQNLGAGHPERSAQAVRRPSDLGSALRRLSACCSSRSRQFCLALFGMSRAGRRAHRRPAAGFLSVSGLFITTALTYTGGLQGTGRYQESAVYLAHLAVCACRSGMLTVPADDAAAGARRMSGWRSSSVTRLRCVFSVWRFRQGKWRQISSLG